MVPILYLFLVAVTVSFAKEAIDAWMYVIASSYILILLMEFRR